MGLGAGLGTAVLAVAGAPDAPVVPNAACAPGTHADAARSARIAHALRSALVGLTDRDDARRLAREPWEPAFCYARRSELREPAQVVLDLGLDDRQAAARAAHLLLHARVAPPWSAAASATCDQKVRAALTAEARARALELAVASALGTTVAVERTPEQLAAAYSERCVREQR
jgi:hypothetical protein